MTWAGNHGLKVIVDLHGGDPEDPVAKAEFREIKDRVMFDVSLSSHCNDLNLYAVVSQRQSGEARSYEAMWHRYKRRVILAMSSQAFAQLVSICKPVSLTPR